MKTKTIITAMLLLFSIASFAQTEAETVAWIKEKLEKHGGNKNYYYKNISVSPCKISWAQDDASEYEFNPSTAKSWTVYLKEYITADDDIINWVNNEFNDSGNTAFLAIKNGESDIHERMIKALLHLATFCEEGKNEAF